MLILPIQMKNYSILPSFIDFMYLLSYSETLFPLTALITYLILFLNMYLMGFLGGSDGKESIQCRRPSFKPWVRKIPWRRE